ncbi:hypothetical protein EIP91_004899 [Steccherinum ochraceum]|uniref:Transmembrane protein n=1 Tax=Steccherinum ochraceum TaxID=92696 RepID=A0A4R0R8N2_9APHY|nr:hypothetical protein EIP91_004899 [Steccherinum ochraceum]
MSSTDQTSKIDDTDPQIRYSGSWGTPVTNDAAVFNGTLTVTSQVGANFAFTFTGVQQIAVYGSLLSTNASPPIIQFSIDNGPHVVYTAPPIDEEDAVLFFQSDVLSPTAHQIVAEVKRASDSSPFQVDYLSVLPARATIPTPTSSDGTVTTVSVSAPPTGSSGDGNQGPSGTPLNVGPIVGGVVGCVTFIFFALLWFWCRRRKQNGSAFRHVDETAPTPAMRDTEPILSDPSAPFIPDHGDSSHITPYLISQGRNASDSQTGLREPFSNSSSPNSARVKFSAPQSLSDPTFARDHTSSFAARAVAAVAAGVTRRSDGRKRVLPQPTTIIHSTSHDSQTQQPELDAVPGPALPEHVDSGMRFHPNAEVEEVPVLPIGAPPAYTAA